MNKLNEVLEKGINLKLNPVYSSNIKAIGYDNENQLMVVLFNSGSKYLYENVEPEIHKLIISSSSIGKTLNECIIRNTNKYTFHKLIGGTFKND